VFCPSDPPDCDKGPVGAAFAARTMPPHGDGLAAGFPVHARGERPAAQGPGRYQDLAHRNIRPHVEGTEGMIGNVNTLIVTPTKVDLTPLLT
jgi:hypothetical protein